MGGPGAYTSPSGRGGRGSWGKAGRGGRGGGRGGGKKPVDASSLDAALDSYMAKTTE